MSDERMIAVITDGVLEVHAAGLGNFATLCGLDGNDPDASQIPAPLPMNPRIDCPQCFSAWKAWRTFSARDFTT